MQRLTLVTAAATAAIVLSFTAAGVARAEHSAIPSSASWSSLEQHATIYASQIAGRAARVQCHGEGEWAALDLPAGRAGAGRRGPAHGSAARRVATAANTQLIEERF